MSAEPRYDVVVVHHDNPEVYGVLDVLAAQRVRPRRVVLIDNSDTIEQSRLPAEGLDVLLIRTENDGYAAAVNLGLRELAPGAPDYVAVLTHEVRLTSDTLPRLMDTLVQRPTLGACGPVLRFRSRPDAIFSIGGRLDRYGRPSHRRPSDRRSQEVEQVSWVDGSVMMLRRRAVEEVGLLDEDYFLYFEEIDLAVRLREQGWGVAIDHRAAAWQEPGGYPPYLAARNRVLLVKRNPRALRAARWSLYPRLAAEVGWSAYRRGLPTLRDTLRGTVHGIAGRSGVPR